MNMQSSREEELRKIEVETTPEGRPVVKRKLKKLSKIKGQGDFRAGGSRQTKAWTTPLTRGGSLEDILGDMVKNGDLEAKDVKEFSDALRSKQREEANRQKLV